jgi:hypothetical protein
MNDENARRQVGSKCSRRSIRSNRLRGSSRSKRLERLELFERRLSQPLELALTKRGGLVQHPDEAIDSAKFTGGCQ